MPHEVSFRREARLIKEQQGKLGLQVMLPSYQKELTLELGRPDAIRPDGVTPALLRKLEPHQLIVPVLGENAQTYTPFSRFQALVPASADREPTAIEKQRYYRLVQALDPEKLLPLSPHPLTWTTTSHVIWDGNDPESLSFGQQRAMIDWLHWGGQLIIVAGAGPSLAPLQDSFLAPYLPATPSGDDALLSADDLEVLSQSHPAPNWPEEGDAGPIPRFLGDGPDHRIRPIADKGLFLTGLEPMPGSTVLPLGDPKGHRLGVEWRVGRGRVLILGVKLTDPVMLSWPGLDTFVRRVVLRRPQESQQGLRFAVLGAPALTWVRYTARDLGTKPTVRLDDIPKEAAYDLPIPSDPAAAWLDNTTMPTQSRRALQEASGITIPGSEFVLRIILAYGLALVPVNWLVCRYLLRRRELAWVVTPLLALGFAVAVERGAAYDLGFDSACDEIDLLEVQGDYSRAHLSRFAALYSTGRGSFTIAYPSDPTALSLPMNMANNLKGGDTLRSSWQTYPEPALTDFPVQPRALAMFRTEQMVNMPAGITLDRSGATPQLVNGTDLELRDAVVVDVAREVQYRLGKIPPGATVPLGSPVALKEEKETDAESSPKTRAKPLASRARTADEFIDKTPFLDALRDANWNGPEDRAEWRLVAWTPKPHPGQELRPTVDRHRGFRLVVAHLDYGPTPSFDMNADHETIAPFPYQAPARPETARP